MGWQHSPPYAQVDPAARFAVKQRARCFCGAIELEVCADPVDSKICHCAACQSLHGAPFQWAVIFHKHHVRFIRGAEGLHFYNGELGLAEHVLPCKLSCKTCRAPIADEGRRMFLAFGSLFHFGHPPSIPAAYQPTCHIFYGARVIDINDDKPKYLGHKGTSPFFEEHAVTKEALVDKLARYAALYRGSEEGSREDRHAIEQYHAAFEALLQITGEPIALDPDTELPDELMPEVYVKHWLKHPS